MSIRLRPLIRSSVPDAKTFVGLTLAGPAGVCAKVISETLRSTMVIQSSNSLEPLTQPSPTLGPLRPHWGKSSDFGVWPISRRAKTAYFVAAARSISQGPTKPPGDSNCPRASSISCQTPSRSSTGTEASI